MCNRNLFTGIVKDENDVTELLVNMMQQKFFRDICLRWLLKEFIACPRTIEALINEIEAKDIRTQYNTISGRPDIVIRSDNCHFLIENKIHVNTDLTPDQKEGYAHIFNDNARYKGLLFLIPREYSHLGSINDVMDKLKHTNIKIDVAYWDNLLSYLYKQEVGEVSDCYKDAMIQMETVIDNMTVFDTRLTSYETAMLYSPHQITDIYERISKIKEILANYSNKSLLNPEWSEDKFGIGYFYNKRKNFIGFGPSVSNPYCFFAYSFESDKPVNGIRSELDKSTGTYWNYYPIKIEDFDNMREKSTIDAIGAVVNNKDLTSVTNIEDDGVLLKMEMDTRATYSLAEKIIKLCTLFVVSNRKLKFSHSQANHEGVGCYFDLENHSGDSRCFIGYGPGESVEKNLYVSIKSSVEKQAEPPFFMIDKWLCCPIEKSCLFYADLKTQQEMFNVAASKALELAELALAKGVLDKNEEEK